MDISLLGEILVNNGVVLDFCKDFLGEETLIVGYVEHLDIVALDATQLLRDNRGTYCLRLPAMRSLRK